MSLSRIAHERFKCDCNTVVGRYKPTFASLYINRTQGSESAKEEPIYIGFKKGDYESREGRQGRVIMGNPKLFPGRDDLFTGGWAGGEAGLWVQREEFKKELESGKAKKATSGKEAPVSSPWSKKGQSIYVGFGKEEEDFKAKASGAKGRIIYDDISKYPGRDDLLTGGFAGGERGLRGFVETGDVQLRSPNEPGGQGTSPLIVAFIILISSGAIGTFVLTQIYDAEVPAAERMEQLKLQAVSVQGSEELLLYLVSGFAVLAAIAGGRFLLASMESKVREAAEGARRAAIIAAFAGGVTLAAKAVFEI